MPGHVFCDPNNPANRVYVMDPSDPSVPIGWLYCNSDGQVMREFQTYRPSASGGYPRYGDPADYASNPKIKYP